MSSIRPHSSPASFRSPFAHSILPRSLVVSLLLAAPLAAQTAPTTEPASQPTTHPFGDDRLVRAYARLYEVDDLTDEQRRALDRIGDEARAEFARLYVRDGDVGSPAMRAAIQRTRVRAIAVLTPAQRIQFRSRAGRAADADAPTTGPAMGDTMMGGTMMAGEPTMTGSAMSGDTMTGEAMTGGTPRDAARRPTPPATRPAAAGARLGVGDRLPSLTLTRVDGRSTVLDSLAGRPAVIVFGSYSSPAFRDQLPRLADLAARYGSRASFVFVYTREMFPAIDGVDQPERNLDEKIYISAAATADERKASAKALLERLKLRVPLALDTADDTLANALDGFPNAAIITDATGTIVARHDWAEPFGIKRRLDALLQQK